MALSLSRYRLAASAASLFWTGVSAVCAASFFGTSEVFVDDCASAGAGLDGWSVGWLATVEGVLRPYQPAGTPIAATLASTTTATAPDIKNLRLPIDSLLLKERNGGTRNFSISVKSDSGWFDSGVSFSST